jgi:hypothetical protein
VLRSPFFWQALDLSVDRSRVAAREPTTRVETTAGSAPDAWRVSRRRHAPLRLGRAVEAHHRAGHQDEREPPPGVPVPAHLQPPPTAQPRPRPLNRPAVPPKACRGLPRRAIRALIPRCRTYARFARLSYPLSAWSLPARCGAAPTGANRRQVVHDRLHMVVSLTLAAVTPAASGSPPPSQTRWTLLPGLPRSTGFAPTWSPRAWPARSWPATSGGWFRGIPRIPWPHTGVPAPSTLQRRGIPRKWHGEKSHGTAPHPGMGYGARW